jgi:hypothetical protein
MRLFTLGRLAYGLFAVAMIAWVPSLFIETDALSHPNHPTAQMTAPLQIKGRTRYVTPTAALVYDVATVSFFASIVGFASLVLTLRGRDRRAN